MRQLFKKEKLPFGKKENNRLIDGKYYGFYGIFTKTLAKEHAQVLRKKGKLVRVIKNKKYGAYDVYVRG